MTVSYLPAAAFSLARLQRLWSLDRPGVVWRHDIDHDLGCARAMGALEARAGITATYYLRADNEAYRWQGKEFARTVRLLTQCGHRLGVHVDLRIDRHRIPSDDYVLVRCAQEWMKLEHLPVGRRVSFHKPPAAVLWRDFEGFEHALGAEWHGRYVSDSRQRFRQSPEVLLRSEGLAQVNLHPCWWFMEPARAEALRREHEVAAAGSLERGITSVHAEGDTLMDASRGVAPGRDSRDVFGHWIDADRGGGGDHRTKQRATRRP